MGYVMDRTLAERTGEIVAISEERYRRAPMLRKLLEDGDAERHEWIACDPEKIREAGAFLDVPYR